MLIKLNIEIGMTLIFIMVRGKFVESGSPDYVILHPQQPYTQRLINDVPKIHVEGDLS